MTGPDTFAFSLVYCTTLGISLLMFLLQTLALLLVLALAGSAAVLSRLSRTTVAATAHRGPQPFIEGLQAQK
ncbi:hypothetical protein IG195_20675 (plasmid) [Arthrobacter sp. TES]|uniref:hypothetical protein n=1 Tax=Paenarthrobacter ureafaciens TaxID=37931 RepID=UPI000397394B|nr:hypothetical protein [Paenarthrobacter ureafaciens]AOY74144.1 hypothetical protein ARZXY2_4645 [Arthrobacter sp. ZXY-2]ERI38008.1 hypothetical protein M707_08120 [Arthrobacter sp. AK-YN10]QOI65778.1 hypothetical protein IG195_20675 [Arthrobacter sp. TES]GLU61094.1 hypothetical protein Pure01_36070 [Paenarthrobacter ureafaciens]GLU65363.1 hypothetical protein Pure02_36130 [Paenarthrobacter ureafaciens]